MIEGFCQLWYTYIYIKKRERDLFIQSDFKNRQAAGAGMILGAVVGTLTMIALLGVMCSNREKRERGWKLISG